MIEIKQTISYAVLWTLAYLGLLQNVQGAFNVFEFFIVLKLIITILMQVDGVQATIKRRSVLSPMFRYFDFAMILGLVWIDHYILAFIMILTSVFAEVAWDSIQKKRFDEPLEEETEE